MHSLGCMGKGLGPFIARAMYAMILDDGHTERVFFFFLCIIIITSFKKKKTRLEVKCITNATRPRTWR